MHNGDRATSTAMKFERVGDRTVVHWLEEKLPLKSSQFSILRPTRRGIGFPCAWLDKVSQGPQPHLEDGSVYHPLRPTISVNENIFLFLEDA